MGFNGGGLSTRLAGAAGRTADHDSGRVARINFAQSRELASGLERRGREDSVTLGSTWIATSIPLLVGRRAMKPVAFGSSILMSEMLGDCTVLQNVHMRALQ